MNDEILGVTDLTFKKIKNPLCISVFLRLG